MKRLTIIICMFLFGILTTNLNAQENIKIEDIFYEVLDTSSIQNSAVPTLGRDMNTDKDEYDEDLTKTELVAFPTNAINITKHHFTKER